VSRRRRLRRARRSVARRPHPDGRRACRCDDREAQGRCAISRLPRHTSR
jgi:hypothetical protein